jgi:membrane protease YdiL (CAAX protease family)
LVIGVIGPVIEEIYFRGILFGWFRRYFRPWVGIIVSSTVFGMLHFKSIMTIAFAFLFGVVLSWLYEHEKSLVYPIVLHMTINIVVTTMNFYLPIV